MYPDRDWFGARQQNNTRATTHHTYHIRMLKAYLEQERCGAIVICPHPTDDRILYCARKSDPSKLGGLPGGKLEPGESFLQAASREFAEETGFTLNPSPALIFEGLNKAPNFYVQVFLGTSEDAWSTAKFPFTGPEGLPVHAAPIHEMLNEEQCVFAPFYREVFQGIAASRPDAFKTIDRTDLLDKIILSILSIKE